jgi:hypothetical protein
MTARLYEIGPRSTEVPKARQTERMRFPISFNKFTVALMTPMGMGRKRSDIVVGDGTMTARMGWGFRATVPISSVKTATLLKRRAISLGIHGWRGTWLVNGKSGGLVLLTIEPAQPARVLGFPIKLRRLIVSVDDPAALVAAFDVPPMEPAELKRIRVR